VAMQRYKGYLIEGTALLVHPFSRDWHVGGSVSMSGRHGSIVELAQFRLQKFTVSIKKLAEWFGLELARIAWMILESSSLNRRRKCRCKPSMGVALRVVTVLRGYWFQENVHPHGCWLIPDD
jgi:hypothetical protein